MLVDDDVAEPVDGRVARRERNIEAVLEVVIEMYGDDMLVPTIEQASKRSGLSLRSLYRYFADPEELHQAAIEHHRSKTRELSHLPAIGEGILLQRIEDYVAMRLRLYDTVAPVFRASVHSAGRSERINAGLERARQQQSDQFERHFAPELKQRRGGARQSLLATGDVLTQLDSIDLFRRARGLSSAETHKTVVTALTALFAD